MDDVIKQFRDFGNRASYHYADDSGSEWDLAKAEKEKALSIYRANPELQEEMKKVAAGFLWPLAMENNMAKSPRKKIFESVDLGNNCSICDALNGCTLDQAIDLMKVWKELYGDDSVFSFDETYDGGYLDLLYGRLEDDYEYKERIKEENRVANMKRRQRERKKQMDKAKEKAEYETYLDLKKKFEK